MVELSLRPVIMYCGAQVDDKYQYSVENKDNKVHGWICEDDPAVGFWMITPSNEFRTSGPNKQDLTSHVGPTNLNVSQVHLIPSHLNGQTFTCQLPTT